ncbi:MAG: glutaredoxin family protein [Brevibacterium yomogidense]|uniref:Probable redoxin n=1 Tax=Brevibacterium yomogidense TaxID=946573 RepID=A0A1X6XHP1_9MICO|nr:glutaredoxin family protein [Brevibacterium yomogidense]SLM98660.1 probable redoxin [Brevibacterium yomogidense]
MVVRVTVLTRTDCGLCSAAEQVVAQVSEGRDVDVTFTDIDTDPELKDRYDWDVPVVLVDGRQVGFHRIDPDRLARAIDARQAAKA